MTKQGNIKPNEALKSVPINDLCEKYSEANTKKSIDLTDEQISFIIQLCESEIRSNDSFLDDLKDPNEKSAWIDTNVFCMKLIKDIKQNFFDKIGTQIVIQELTKEQEDYIIECGLEEYRTQKEVLKK